MHNLVIDIGNTNSKAAVFNDRSMVHFRMLNEVTPEAVDALIDEFQIGCATVSSVSAELEGVIGLLKIRTNYVPFSTAVNTGIQNNYKTLSTLGQDRWAKMIAAHHYYNGKNCLVIDAGTCITYDLLTEVSEYNGGTISPGIDMRFKALNHYTGRLPLVDWDKKAAIPEGTDTRTAIQHGVLAGVMNEVEGFIAHENKRNSNLTVLITGGNGEFLLDQLKNSIFVPQIIYDPYLLLKGLNEVIVFEYVQKN